jgi:hypothetical protein
VHRAAGGDSPGSPRTPQLEALSRRLNAEVEQLRAENARLSVRGSARRLHLRDVHDTAGRASSDVQCKAHARPHACSRQGGTSDMPKAPSSVLIASRSVQHNFKHSIMHAPFPDPSA